MITPRFTISQNEKSIIVAVYAPNARLKDTEVSVNGKIILFTATPYFLRLHLPHDLQDIEEDDEASVSFNADKNDYTIVCTKQEPGQHFSGLDMLTSLLTPKEVKIKPSIELVDESSSLSTTDTTDCSNEELDLDWFEPQELPTEILTSAYKYGFADSHSNVAGLKDVLYGVLDLPDPNTNLVERRQLRHDDEAEKFRSEHYLADYFKEGDVESYFSPDLAFKSSAETDVQYSKDEEAALLQLPRRELLVEQGKAEARVLVGLVSLLLSWSYNHRISGGEESAESAWNYTKLSPQLSWFDTPGSLVECVKVFGRRAVVYPFVRHFSMVQFAIDDTIAIFSLGPKQVLKCLLEMRRVFNNTENFYLLNDLYVTEYCIWVQTVSPSKLATLAELLKQVDIKKSHLDFQLDELEEMGKRMMEESSSESEDEEKPISPESPSTATTCNRVNGVQDVQLIKEKQPSQQLTFHNPVAASNEDGVFDMSSVAASLTSSVNGVSGQHNNNAVEPLTLRRSLTDAAVSDDSDDDSSSSEDETDSDDTDSDDDSSSSSSDSSSSDSDSENDSDDEQSNVSDNEQADDNEADKEQSADKEQIDGGSVQPNNENREALPQRKNSKPNGNVDIRSAPTDL